RLRVLVVGRSGTGRSSLINYVLGIKKQAVSDQTRGVSDIEEEITSPENPRLVLHESRGFEPGEETSLKNAVDFLDARSSDSVAVKDQVHVVLCIKIPHAGGGVLETGDKKLIEFAFEKKVPLIVVFTQFDKLISLVEQELTDEEMDMDLEECELLVMTRGAAKFGEICLPPLKTFEHIHYARTMIT
ncbi:hypothetical protein R3P38DRAFT_2556886, partial [Favolaschia claudopus]